MNVFKYNSIVISNYFLKDNILSFTISYDENLSHKEIAIPEFMDKQVFFDMYRMALGVAAYSYALVAKNVYVEIPMSDAQYDFLKRIEASFYTNLRIFLGNIMMAPSCIGIVHFKFDETFKETIIGRIIPNTATLLYSGGKESLLCDLILKESGIKVRKLLVNSSLYAENPGIKAFRDCHVIDSSDAFLFDESVIYDGTWDNPAFAFERIVFAMIDMVSNRSQYLCVGNEYETTGMDFTNFGGSLSYGRSWQQSNFALKEFQRYLFFIYYGGEVFSPVQNMTMIFEEAVLTFLYPEYLDKQCTCVMTFVEDNDLQPCLTCVKCRILNAILSGFNKILAKNGMKKISSVYLTDESVETVPSTPVHFGEHYLDDEQLHQVEELCKGNFEDSYFKLIFDTLHSEAFLPKKVLRTVKHIEVSLNKIIEQWKN